MPLDLDFADMPGPAFDDLLGELYSPREPEEIKVQFDQLQKLVASEQYRVQLQTDQTEATKCFNIMWRVINAYPPLTATDGDFVQNYLKIVRLNPNYTCLLARYLIRDEAMQESNAVLALNELTYHFQRDKAVPTIDILGYLGTPFMIRAMIATVQMKLCLRHKISGQSLPVVIDSGSSSISIGVGDVNKSFMEAQDWAVHSLYFPMYFIIRTRYIRWMFYIHDVQITAIRESVRLMKDTLRVGEDNEKAIVLSSTDWARNTYNCWKLLKWLSSFAKGAVPVKIGNVEIHLCKADWDSILGVISDALAAGEKLGLSREIMLRDESHTEDSQKTQ